MTTVPPVPERPASEPVSPKRDFSAEANLGTYAKRALLLAPSALALFAVLVGIMFTLMSTVGILGILAVLAAVGLLVVSANVTVGQRHAREEDRPPLPSSAPPVPG